MNLNLGECRAEAFVMTLLPSRDHIFEMEANTDEAETKIENLDDNGYLKALTQGALLDCSGTLITSFRLSQF